MKYWKRKIKRLLYLGSSLKVFTHENGGAGVERKKKMFKQCDPLLMKVQSKLQFHALLIQL